MNNALRQAIASVSDAAPDINDSKLASLGAAFRDAFLLGYETYDNLDCAREIVVGRTNDGTSAKRPTIGYVFPSLGVDISDVLNSAEGCDIPAQLLADYPEITQKQWDATLRMATMFFVALQGQPAPGGEIAG